MMLGKIKYGKITVVIFLTILIWVWADLALDDDVTVPKATINAAFSKDIWVSFNDKPSVSIYNIKLKGPAGKIAEVRRRLNEGTLVLDFLLNPEREGMTTTGLHSLKVLDFVKKSEQMKIKELGGLTVEACTPELVDVNVVELEERALDIECFNENGALLEVESIEPSSKVVMFVPAGSRLTARVRLTPRDIEQARRSVVVKTPFVVLAEGQKRQASAPVEIKMSPEGDSLSEYNIEQAKVLIAMSVNLMGEYDVKFNHNEVVSPFLILATPEAKQAYEDQPYQMTLYILDDDKNKEPEEVIPRNVVYNFPEEFVRRDEIKLKDPQQAKEAKFYLIPLTSTKISPAGVD
jgi:hypothetical protein